MVPPHFVGAHMVFRQAVSVFALVLGLGASAAFAQGDIPAEFPPSSFTGKQYVDSRGCVFVRAGISGNTTWIPRVTRQRKQICGMRPSLAGQTRTVEARTAPETPAITAPQRTVQEAPRRPVAPRIFQRQPGKPIDTVASIRPAPKPVAQPKAQPQRVVRAPAEQQKVVVRRPVVASAPAPKLTRRQAACQGASSLSSRYINSGAKADVRCGPQAEAPVAIVRGSTLRRSAPAQRVTITAPTRTVAISPPPGYRRVWEDDRLNPNRGPRTAQGDAQMAQVWTDTVPRKAVKQSSRVRGTAACQGASQLSSRYINSGQRAAVRCGPQAEAPVTYVTRKAVPKQRLSAMNAPAQRKPAQAARAASHRYVQVGTFGVPQNATKTARRLQSTGLPVRLSKYSKGGKNYTIVLAGPFGTQSQLNSGLNTARKAGFRDAFLRR